MATRALSQPRDQIEALTRINLDDMLDNFGLRQARHGRALIERVLSPPAQRLARQVADFDRRVGEAGLQAGSGELVRRYVNRVDVVGAEHIPLTGGVLFAANHPGMADNIACFASIPRADLHIMSTERPFVRALTHVAQHIFFVSDQANERLAVVRQVARFLQNGGAVIINPAGGIEPDPAVMPGAIESLDRWSESLGLFVRLAPGAAVVPMLVSGVIHRGSLHNPLTRLRRAQKDRERVAATLQAFWLTTGLIKHQLNVRIEFGAPLHAADLIALGGAAAITHAITAAVENLMAPIVQLAR
jgi:1-acyl-sn-glycerol-3-phosphate acyltransferase